MELVLIGLAALLTSGLTLFSGFGLGTILMPVFALFFPLPLAIAATAVSRRLLVQHPWLCSTDCQPYGGTALVTRLLRSHL